LPAPLTSTPFPYTTLFRSQVKTVLRSGGDVRVKSGTARIDLVEGGQISICGPAHLSVLKSGGSLTIALDTGTIHVHIEDHLAVKDRKSTRLNSSHGSISYA